MSYTFGGMVYGSLFRFGARVTAHGTHGRYTFF